MHVLIGYGHYPGTTGIYFEHALAQLGDVTFVGRGSIERPGYAPNVDLCQLVAKQPTPPDFFLYVDSGNNPYAPVGLEQLPCPTVGYFMDALPDNANLRNPYLETLAPLFDHLFVAHKVSVEKFTALHGGQPVYWLPPACDPQVHVDQQLERIYDVGFVGQVTSSYPERVRMLEALGKRYKLNDYHRRYYREEMARIYSQSKIVLNISVTDQILVMRFFEAPPSGALLLTERSAVNGQNELLREGEEFVTFKGLDELLEKVDYYLAHDEERERIARAGQAAMLTKHTYVNRMQQLVATVQQTPARAPAREWPADKVRAVYMQAHAQLRLVDSVMATPGVGRSEKLKYALPALLRQIKHQG